MYLGIGIVQQSNLLIDLLTQINALIQPYIHCNLVKNISNNTNSLNLTSEFEIQFLVAIFAMILITTTLTVGSKSVDIFAQGNNSSTNRTSHIAIR